MFILCKKGDIMIDVRIRQMSDELHSALKIEAVKQKTTLEKLIKNFLSEAMKMKKVNGE